MSTNCDVIIMDTGAGGGTLARRLAPTGERILLLERGDYVRREKENWSSRAVNIEGRYQTKENWRDNDGNSLHPHTNYNVGGNTKFYGAALFRPPQGNFRRDSPPRWRTPAWSLSYITWRVVDSRARFTRSTPSRSRAARSGKSPFLLI